VTPAWSQEIPYTIIGKYRDVKVVDELPLNIVIQPGIGFYRWSYPITAKCNEKGNVLEILSAPQGNLTVKLAVESAVGKYNDNTKLVDITYVTKNTEFMFFIGGVTPIPPPIPPGPVPPIPIPPTPVPVDPLVATIQAAYTADLDPNKAANTASLAGLYHVAADPTAFDPTVKTVGDLYTRLKVASTNLKLTNAITTVRGQIAVELNKMLPTDPNAALTDAIRKTASETFKRIEYALGQCK
jgi:hypothetical protein